MQVNKLLVDKVHVCTMCRTDLRVAETCKPNGAYDARIIVLTYGYRYLVCNTCYDSKRYEDNYAAWKQRMLFRLANWKTYKETEDKSYYIASDFGY